MWICLYGRRPQLLLGLLPGALNQLARSLACEWAKDNIRVNSVAPGAVDTPLMKPVSPPSILSRTLVAVPHPKQLSISSSPSSATGVREQGVRDKGVAQRAARSPWRAGGRGTGGGLPLPPRRFLHHRPSRRHRWRSHCEWLLLEMPKQCVELITCLLSSTTDCNKQITSSCNFHLSMQTPWICNLMFLLDSISCVLITK